MDDTFWDWLNTLNPFTQERVIFDIVKETQEKGRDLTDEELNEIRAKYEPHEPQNDEVEIDDGNDEEANGQEEDADQLPECAGENPCAGGDVQQRDDSDTGNGERAE